jgi:hypothetical protein
MTAWLTAAGTIRKDTGVGEIGIFVVSADMALYRADREFSGMSDRYDAPGLDQLGAKFYFSKILPDGSALVGPGDKELRFESRIEGKRIGRSSTPAGCSIPGNRSFRRATALRCAVEGGGTVK